MAKCFADEAPGGNAADCVLAMGPISVALLLEKPEIYKAVIGSLGVASATPGSVRQNSQALWSLALADFDGVAVELRELAIAVLAEQLAFAFRGCTSSWIAGEIQDEDFGPAFQAGACSILLAFIEPGRRTYLIDQITRLRGRSPES